MSSMLYLWPRPDEARPIRWLLWDVKRQCQQSTGESHWDQLGELASEFGSSGRPTPTTLLVPGELCTLHQLTLPGRSKAAISAIPYMLEEKLCQSVDELHFVHSPPDRQNLLDVQVIDAELLSNWIIRVQQAGLNLVSAVADYLLLPRREQPVIFCDDDRLLIRSDAHATTLDVSLLPFWWPLTQRSPQCLLIGEESAELFRSLDLQTQTLQPDANLTTLVQQADRQAASLLQGRFEQRNPFREMLKGLKPALILGGVALLLYLGSIGISNYQLKQQVALYESQMAQIYRDAFPEARRIVNPRSQMRAKLNELKSGTEGGFLRMLERLSQTFERLDGTDLTSLRFQADTGRMTLQLTSGSYQMVEKFSAALTKQGFKVESGAQTQNSDGKVSALITLSEVGQ